MKEELYRILTKKIKEDFNRGVFWNIYRQSTILDMIVLNYYAYQKKNTTDSLILILDLFIKLKVSMLMKVFPFEVDMNKSLLKLKSFSSYYIRLYNQIIKQTFSSITIYEDGKIYDEMNYIKVLNDLNLHNINDETINNVISVIMKQIIVNNRIND